MRKILFSILITIFSVNIFSDDHGIKPGNVVAEFHYFDVTDPMTFVATVDKFDVSSCAQEWREKSGVNIGLYALGGGSHSHLILVVYDDFDQMQLGRSIFGACRESAQMIKSMDTSSNSHMYYNFVTELALESGDWRTDTVFANVDIKVESGEEAEYLKAWVDFMESQESVGSFGINRILFGNKYYTHMIYLGSNSLSELTNSMKTAFSSRDYQTYLNKVEDIRTNVQTRMAQFVKAYPNER